MGMVSQPSRPSADDRLQGQAWVLLNAVENLATYLTLWHSDDGV
jgi:hypothetical protein